MYSADQVDELMGAEMTSRMVKNASKTGKLIPIPSKKMETDIIREARGFWDDEPANLKKDFRGIKIPPKSPPKNKLGKDEWPKPPTAGSRKVETIAQGGRFRRVEVDGHRVKAAYEVTTADGTKIRAYDMSSRRNRDTQQSLATAAYMHELYPHSPPKKMVFLSGGQTSRAAGYGTNAFVVAGSDYVFMNKKPLKIRDPEWMMPSMQNTNAAHYTAVHEFGHQFDFTNRRRSSVGLWNTPSVKRSLSTYGRYNSHEGYAEAFAEWHVSQGKTTNPAARAYALQNKWHGSSGSLALAADGWGNWTDLGTGSIYISYDPPEEEWNPWEIAAQLGILTEFVEEEFDFDGSAEPEDDEDTIFTKFPKGMPIIADNFNDGKPRLINMEDWTATEQELEEAKEIARQVFEELGIDEDEE